MQAITVAGTIPASGTIPNNLTGQAPEYLGEAAQLTLYGNSNDGATTHSLTGFRGASGEPYVPAGSNVGVASTAGKVKTNEDFLGQFPVPASTRLVHQVVGTATKTVLFQYVVA